MKHRTYDAILTDSTAFTIGTAMLCCYLERRNLLLGVLTVLGAFTWPTLIIQGTLLIVFACVDKEADARDSGWMRICSGGAAIVFVAAAAYLLAKGATLTMPAYMPAVPLSLAAAAAYLWYGIGHIVPSRRALMRYLTPDTAVRVLSVAAAIIVVKIVQADLASMTRTYAVGAYLDVTVLSAMMYPAAHLVSHAVYFGPLVLLLILRWSDAAEFGRHYNGIAV